MEVYLITRNCVRKDKVDPRTGPPIAIYTTEMEAQYRLTEWQVEHPWDDNVYRILETHVNGDPDSFLNNELYVVIRLCEDIPACESNTTCGPPMIVCFSRFCAIDSIQKWRQNHPSEKAYFQIKKMELKGTPDRRKKKFFIYRLFGNVDN